MLPDHHLDGTYILTFLKGVWVRLCNSGGEIEGRGCMSWITMPDHHLDGTYILTCCYSSNETLQCWRGNWRKGGACPGINTVPDHHLNGTRGGFKLQLLLYRWGFAKFGVRLSNAGGEIEGKKGGMTSTGCPVTVPDHHPSMYLHFGFARSLVSGTCGFVSSVSGPACHHFFNIRDTLNHYGTAWQFNFLLVVFYVCKILKVA